MSTELSVGQALLLRDIYTQRLSQIAGRAGQMSVAGRPPSTGEVAPPARPTRSISALSPDAAGDLFASVLTEVNKRRKETERGFSHDARHIGQRSNMLRSISNSLPAVPSMNSTAWDMDDTTVDQIPFADLIVAAAKKYGVSASLIAAVVQAESAFNPLAQSRAGAKGLMQLMDDTARSLGVLNVFDPAQNIDGGVRFLGSLLKRYRGDLNLSLAAYNAGPAAVEKYGGVPPYQETRNYISKVLNYARQFARLSLE